MDVLLLSPVNPFDPRDGHRMAVASDLRAMLDCGLTVGVVGLLYPGQEQGALPYSAKVCAAKLYRVRGGAFPKRFVRGLLSGVPPSSERLYPADAKAGVRKALQEWKPRYVIVDDVSMAGYLPAVRELAPQAKVVLRTHNVMHDVRAEHLRNSRGLLRVPVGWDCWRYAAFEAKSVAASDALWAISAADAARMRALYGKPAEVLSISIGEEKYLPLRLEEGADQCFVHVGTLDFRRKSDLEHFLHESWPRIREAAPQAALNLAGQLHGKAVAAPGATYSGLVKDDAEVYRLGRFALNFQTTTGGIKLKTLTSLAAGRTLVSTSSGVEGLALTAGEHYLEMQSFLSGARVKELIGDPEQARQMGAAGREWVLQHHSRAAIARQFAALLAGV